MSGGGGKFFGAPQMRGAATAGWFWMRPLVKPRDAGTTLLPWGFVSQEVVKSKVVPETLRRRHEISQSRPVTQWLAKSGHDLTSMQPGAEAAYRFAVHEFNRREASFSTRLTEQMEPSLSALFDLQLKQLQGARRKPDAGPMVEVHAVHECTVTTAFPIILFDGEGAQSSPIFRVFGLNFFTTLVYFCGLKYSGIFRQVVFGGDHGARLAVEVLIKSSETVRYGPGAGVKRDATHVLWFLGGRNKDIFRDKSIDFELANWNEALGSPSGAWS
jgi:hypothetical protein